MNRLYISLYLTFFVQRKGFDLIEFHDYGGDAPFFIGGLPKIIRCHGSALTLHEFMGYTKRITDTIFEKKVFKRFHTHVIAVSNYAAETTQQAFQLKVLPKVIYNGVAIPKTIPSQSNYLEAPTIPKALFYFGSIRERKGIDNACAIFNTIVAQFPEATFHVLGNNNNDHWNKVAVKILTPSALLHTTYYGPIPNTDIYEYLSKAHVVLFPSFGENFSIALLEVMALGKVVITSNIPSFKEIIKHKENGLIATEDDDYIAYITQLFNGDLPIDTISKQAKATIINDFGADTMTRDNIAYYKSVLKSY
jgi:glycosyltransferase involved in cell wall biosynthesis